MPNSVLPKAPTWTWTCDLKQRQLETWNQHLGPNTLFG